MNCTHSVQGRLDQVLSTEICMEVVECVQIVYKLQVSILHTTFDTVCCLLLHGVGVMEQIVAHHLVGGIETRGWDIAHPYTLFAST